MRPDFTKPNRSGLVELGHPVEEFDYERAVGQALEQIHAGEISKVVLARKLAYATSSPLRPFYIAHALRERFPECFTFCLSTPGQGIMVGATPETLAKASRFRSKPKPWAGSAPRGFSAGKDAHWGKTLLGREKDLREHQLVIEASRRLSSIGLNDFEEGKSRLLRLANLQHIRTPLRAKLLMSVHPFDALSALHPTPAMGGTPRKSALSLVRKLEGSPRGGTRGHGMAGLQGARRIHRSHSLWKNQARLPHPLRRRRLGRRIRSRTRENRDGLETPGHA